MLKFLVFILSLAVVSKGFAVDCDNIGNEIEKLICATKPILLKAMTPGLDIPKCNSKNTLFKVSSETEATAGVFVSCLQENSTSCLNIVRALAKDGGGAKVNLVIKNSDIGFFQPHLEAILKEKGGENINIIPLSSSSIPYFMRDFGVIRSSGKNSEIIANPYLVHSGHMGNSLFRRHR